MLIGIDASRANEVKKTGVGWYTYFLIEELKHLSTLAPEHLSTRGGVGAKALQFVLYTREPLRGELANLPENWTVKVLKWPPKRLWTQVRLSWEMLWRAPDVLFVPAHVFPIVHPKKTVMTIHDVAAIKFPKSYGWFERWYSIWSARVALKKLWKIIVPTQFVKEELLQITNSKLQIPNKIVVVMHGYDERYGNCAEISEEILRKFNIKKPYILSIGRLEEKKNTRRIVEAFNKVKLQATSYKLQLVLVGSYGHGYEKVQEAIENSQFRQDIITPGWVSDEDLPTLMRGASVFVFPSLAEGFGMPVLEAFASGTPVVASRGGALQEVGGDACVYVDPMSVNEIADAISKLQIQNYPDKVRDPVFHRDKSQIVERGLARVKEFGWVKCADETMNMLVGN